MGWGSKAFRVCFCFPFFISWVVFVGLCFEVGGEKDSLLGMHGFGIYGVGRKWSWVGGGGFRELKRGFVQQQ